MKVFIGLTTYGSSVGEGRYFLYRDYIDRIVEAHGIPLLLPPVEEVVVEYLSRIDGLVLTGGGDITPRLYDGKEHEMLYGIDEERDYAEIALAKSAISIGMPVLAICRGMQILNMTFGGTLFPHLPDVLEGNIEHRSSSREPIPHAVIIQNGSLLTRILGTQNAVVSSWHHQGIKSLGQGLVATAWAEDGLIEAIEFKKREWVLAVQWHPECKKNNDDKQIRLFSALVSEAARKKTDNSDCRNTLVNKGDHNR